MTDLAVHPTSRAALLARGHLPVLDAYRALAALAVVATHVGFQTGMTMKGLPGALVSRLDIGVALFFALSGFLLYRPWAVALETGTRGPRVPGYLWRRALRILPAYWVVVVAALAWLPDNTSATPSTWLANLGLIQIYVPHTLAHGLTQMWSLASEVAFYLALPGLAWLTSRLVTRRVAPLRSALLIGTVMVVLNVLWLVWIHRDGEAGLRGFWLPTFLTWFAVGMVLAAVVAHVAAGRPVPRAVRPLLTLADQPGACWALAAGVFLVVATPLGGPRALEAAPTPGAAVLKSTAYAVVVGVALLPATLGLPNGRFHQVLSTPVLRFTGDISYGIFLWHLVVIAAVFAATDRTYFTGGFAPTLVETVLGTLAVAAVSWTVLERPVLRLKSRVPM